MTFIESRAREAIQYNAEWDFFFLCKGKRRYYESYIEIERLDEGHNDARNRKR